MKYYHLSGLLGIDATNICLEDQKLVSAEISQLWEMQKEVHIVTFDGIDWTELSKHFGLYSESDSDEMVLKKTKDFLLENHFPTANDAVANTIRCFLVALRDKCSSSGRYSTPVWNGLLEIKDNRTLIKYTIILLEHMWY